MKFLSCVGSASGFSALSVDAVYWAQVPLLFPDELRSVFYRKLGIIPAWN